MLLAVAIRDRPNLLLMRRGGPWGAVRIISVVALTLRHAVPDSLSIAALSAVLRLIDTLARTPASAEERSLLADALRLLLFDLRIWAHAPFTTQERVMHELQRWCGLSRGGGVGVGDGIALPRGVTSVPMLLHFLRMLYWQGSDNGADAEGRIRRRVQLSAQELAALRRSLIATIEKLLCEPTCESDSKISDVPVVSFHHVSQLQRFALASGVPASVKKIDGTDTDAEALVEDVLRLLISLLSRSPESQLVGGYKTDATIESNVSAGTIRVRGLVAHLTKLGGVSPWLRLLVRCRESTRLLVLRLVHAYADAADADTARVAGVADGELEVDDEREEIDEYSIPSNAAPAHGSSDDETSFGALRQRDTLLMLQSLRSQPLSATCYAETAGGSS